MKKVLKFGCLGILGLFTLLVIIGSLVGGGEEEKVTTTAQPETNSEEVKEEPKQEEKVEEKSVTVGIGQELQVGDVVFTVNGVEETTEISDAGGYIKHHPEADGATFLIANVTIKNNGTEAIQTDSSFFKILTSDGIEYSPSTIIVTDDSFFLFDSINPKLSQTGKVLFEVPSGMTGLQLQVQTGFWGTETGIINLQ